MIMVYYPVISLKKRKGWVDLGQKYNMYEKVNHVRSRHYTSHALQIINIATAVEKKNLSDQR